MIPRGEFFSIHSLFVTSLFVTNLSKKRTEKKNIFYTRIVSFVTKFSVKAK